LDTANTKNCTVTTAISMANDLIRQHLDDDRDIIGWTVRIDTAKRRFGYCRYRDKTISLSSILITINSEQRVRETILHEIAHAIAGYAAGHGPEWKRVSTSIGGPPNRCSSAEITNIPEGKYTLVCDTCGFSTFRHRQTNRKKSCSKCFPHYFNEKYLLRLVANR